MTKITTLILALTAFAFITAAVFLLAIWRYEYVSPSGGPAQYLLRVDHLTSGVCWIPVGSYASTVADQTLTIQQCK